VVDFGRSRLPIYAVVEVEPGRADTASTPAAVSSQASKPTSPSGFTFIQTFGATFSTRRGLIYPPCGINVGIRIKRHLNLDVSFVWDYTRNPRPSPTGTRHRAMISVSTWVPGEVLAPTEHEGGRTNSRML